ncbi:FapA family protein [Psychrobacillus sp. PGGUH221]|uniref:flagellar assembly protein A n=1 Tax=Psychrobacillus sp. PGGUH221 TaxID=3020058 RepID=UPI0035C78342
MRSIISKGKNVTEAVQIGLELLDAQKNEVDIEIIEQEKKGFLGIGHKLATVKISKQDVSVNVKQKEQQVDRYEKIKDLERSIEILPESLEITQVIASSTSSPKTQQQTSSLENEAIAWIKGGRLFVQNSPTHYPSATIEEGIEVSINGSLVKEKAIILSQDDDVDIYGIQEEGETKWSVSVDSNKLRVLLVVEPGYKIKRTIRDIEPSQHITLSADEVTLPINTLTYEQVVQAMGSLNVIYGFNNGEIMKAIEATENGTFEIATGTSALPGQDGWIEMKVNIDIDKNFKENELGKVDYREQRIIHSVEPGTIIGIIHPPVPGRPGVTVTNEPLPAKRTNLLQVKAGQGISVIEDKIVALEAGRPSIEQRGRFVKASILQKMVHPGDVNLSSGNIHFKGDVTILGSVQDNMVVEARGNIIVHKSINGAKVESLNSIIAHQNVIGSELSAGKNNLLIAEMGYLLATLSEQLDRMVAVINQLAVSSAFKLSDFPKTGLKPLLHILLEKKFKSFSTIAKNYLNLFKNGEPFLVDEEWLEVSILLKRLFLTISNEFITMEVIDELSLKVKSLYEFTQIPAEPNSFINISSATNSQLYCSGDVTITGKGCINTKIHSEGRLEIKKVLRGGEVYAKEGIQINETGSESGVSTIISVPTGQSIQINKAMEGTILKIGSARRDIKETTHFINACINKNGQVVFE